jgi:hypothetical protein
LEVSSALGISFEFCLILYIDGCVWTEILQLPSGGLQANRVMLLDILVPSENLLSGGRNPPKPFIK